MRRTFSILLLLSGLAGCSASVPSVCPPFPEPDPRVIQELLLCCVEQDQDGALAPSRETQALWDWLDRVYKLRDQLEVCR
jgi:hypothetical protein